MRKRRVCGEDCGLSGFDFHFRDVMLLITARILVRVEAESDVPAIAGNIVIREAGVSGLQRKLATCKQIAAFSSLQVEYMQVRLTAVREPMVPVTKTGMVNHMRLDLVVFLVLQALRLRLLAFAVRPHPGNKRNLA